MGGLSPTKKGIRCLGIAESFVRGKPKSVLAGVVMRRDLIVDGVALTRITVGGMDATEGVLRIYRALRRQDINFMLLNGCIISWFNIIDLDTVYRETGVPLICLTYEESGGLEKYIREYFPPEDAEKRIEAYRRLGERVRVFIKRTGATVYIRVLGMDVRTARALLNAFTITGSVPEPVRLANLFARAVLRASG